MYKQIFGYDKQFKIHDFAIFILKRETWSLKCIIPEGSIVTGHLPLNASPCL